MGWDDVTSQQNKIVQHIPAYSIACFCFLTSHVRHHGTVALSLKRGSGWLLVTANGTRGITADTWPGLQLKNTGCSLFPAQPDSVKRKRKCIHSKRRAGLKTTAHSTVRILLQSTRVGWTEKHCHTQIELKQLHGVTKNKCIQHSEFSLKQRNKQNAPELKTCCEQKKEIKTTKH